MKATLSFSLPEEQEEYAYHKNGPKYHTVIWNVLNEFCRKKIKYESDQHTEEYLKAVNDVRDFIAGELKEENVGEDF